MKCENCGSPLKIDVNNIYADCEYCKQRYLVKELITDRRIDVMDKTGVLRQYAENALDTFQYEKALKAYEQLLHLKPTDIDIARYNLCLLSIDGIEPTKDLYYKLTVLDGVERYRHIREIKRLMKDTMVSLIEEIWHNMGYRGIPDIIRLRLHYNMFKWYYDMVRPMKCKCGKHLGKGEECRCGVKREQLVRAIRVRKILIAICTILGVVIFLITKNCIK